MKPFRLLGAVVALATLAATTAEARNRATETMYAQIRQQGISEADIARKVTWYRWADVEMLPGIYQSIGGFSSLAQPQVTLRGVQLSNESDLAVCVRFRGRLLSGPLLGGRGSSREGTTLLLQPGQREVMMAHTVASYLGKVSLGTSVTGYYFWLPAPTGSEGRCAAKSPDDLGKFLSNPLPNEATIVLLYSRELAERLSAAAPLPVPALLRAPVPARLK